MRAPLFCSVVVLGVGCSSSTGTSLGIAAAEAAVNIAAAAIVHEATGDCYSVCSYGTVCNRQTGFCVAPSELPAPTVPSTEVTLDERCAAAHHELVEDRRAGLGDKHPAVQSLEAVIARCAELTAAPDETTQRCGPLDLDIVLLKVDGYGANHPSVKAAAGALDECRSSARRAPH
ncbi:MAG: hypothetical protein U0271_15965 [Polyangiaceae bacterium]